MNAPKIAPPLAGKTIGTADDSFVIAEWQDAGAPSGPPRFIAPLHVHHQDEEAWYVLEGKLCVQMDNEVVEAPAGSCVIVRRGVKHTYWNPAPERVRYLLVMPPRIQGLIREIHELKERSRESLSKVFQKYDSELL